MEGALLINSFVRLRLLPALKECGLSTEQIVEQSCVQEVVYLLEQFGFELGYRFKWELCGPFSPELAEELFDLDVKSVESAPSESGFRDAQKVTELLAPPSTVELEIPEWLRLLISVDFVERRDPGATENGGTPPFIAKNFKEEEVAAARSRVAEALVG